MSGGSCFISVVLALLLFLLLRIVHVLGSWYHVHALVADVVWCVVYFYDTSRSHTWPRRFSNIMGLFTCVEVVGALRVFPGGNQVDGLPPAPSLGCF